MTENKRESFVFYSSFDETLREMDEKDELAARRAICDYAFRGIEPDKSNIIVRIFFKSVKPLLDKSYQNYLNGKNGGRPKKTEPKPKQNPVETELKPNGNQNKTEPKPNLNRIETPLSNDNDNDKDKDNDVNVYDYVNDDSFSLEKNIKKENPIEPEIIMPEKKSKRFQKPTLDEINQYCAENNIFIDAAAFYDYYESKGWLVGKTPMKDWRAATRNWQRHSKPGGGEEKSYMAENLKNAMEAESFFAKYNLNNNK